MKFTFGIITAGGQDNFLEEIIASIRQQNIPEYEILIVGNTSLAGSDIRIIPFDETIKQKWITRKKNLITQNAQYDNIVYMHDYVALCEGWYKGFLKVGETFKVCMTRILNKDGSRYRDWTLWAFDNVMNGIPKHGCLLPYEERTLSRFMYISGSYWVAKKEAMLQYPLNERLCWGEGEDVEWSKEIRKKYIFSMNPHSAVQLLKQKDRAFNFISEESLMKIREIK